MKFFGFFILLFALNLPFSAQAGEAELIGNWERRDGVAKAVIYRCGVKFCARNFWVRSNARSDNLDDHIIITIKDENEQTILGEAYSPNHRVKLSVEAQINDNNLRTKGCLLGGLICKTWAWQRMQN